MKAAENSQIIGRIAHYSLYREISTGGMGRIYEAWDERLERKVAVKILRPEVVRDTGVVEKFKVEGKALAKLNHPNVVRVYSLEQEDDVSFIVMELITGETLTSYLEKNTPGLRTQIDIFTQFLNGLNAAHEAGLIHRDIKPANVMIGNAGVVQLIDFGLAKVHVDGQAEKTSGDLFWGTPNYVAPELFDGQAPSVSTDIYAAGVLLFYILAGAEKMKQAFPANKRGEMGRALNSLLNPILPNELKFILADMTQKNPVARYKKAGDILQDLKQIDWHSVHPALMTDVKTGPILDHQRLSQLQLDAQDTALLQQAYRETGNEQTAMQQMRETKAAIIAERLEAADERTEKPPVWPVLLVFLLVAGAFAAMLWPKQQAPPLVLPAAQRPPVIKTGSTFSYNYTEFADDGQTPARQYKRAWTLERMSNQLLTFAAPGGEKDEFTNELFPMEPNEQKSIQVRYSNGFDLEWDCKAGSKLHDVATAAGTFAALDIFCTGGPRGLEKLTYAPKLGHWVTRETASPRVFMELNGFNIP